MREEWMRGVRGKSGGGEYGRRSGTVSRGVGVVNQGQEGG